MTQRHEEMAPTVDLRLQRLLDRVEELKHGNESNRPTSFNPAGEMHAREVARVDAMREMGAREARVSLKAPIDSESSQRESSHRN